MSTAGAEATGSFGSRLAAVFETQGRLCVGLDPHPGMLADWGLSDDASGLVEFGQRVIEAASGQVGVVKPQVAFYEAYGPEGMHALAETIGAAREAGLLVLADAKRGDIGSTMAAYAAAWLDPESPFGVDALTVSPFLGFGALQPAVEAARKHRAGLFVLALTSNPEGQQVQLASREGSTVAAQIGAEAAALNTPEVEAGAPLGSVGLVVGATTAQLAAEYGIDLTAGRPPLLAPGYGAQGATADQMRSSFGPAWDQVLVNTSRAVLRQGPRAEDLRAAIKSAKYNLR